MTIRSWALGLAVAVVTAVGWRVGVDGAAGLAPRLALPVSEAPAWGAAWSGQLQSSGQVAAAELGERALLVAGAWATLGLLAVLAALLAVLGERETVRPALAVRWAQGAGPWRLVRERLGGAWGGVVRSSAAGLVGGGLLAALATWTWPVEGLAAPAAPVFLPVVLALPAVLLLAALWPLVGLAERAPTLLRAGAGITDDPRAGTVRRVAATAQLAVAFGLLLGGVTLLAPPDRAPAERTAAAGEDSLLIPLRAAGVVDWGRVERLLGATAPESLSTPGAWTGRGARDLVTVECGACSRGGLPLPFYGVRATLHAVSPGFFGAARMEVVAGRGFDEGDSADAEPVGVVTRAFARDHFEDGDPLGHRVMLSGTGPRWVEVVGVVEPLPFEAPGSSAPSAPVLYLPLAQHSADAVEWARPVEAGEPAGLLPEGVVRPSGAQAVPLSARRAELLRPVRWSATALALAGMLGALVAWAGAAATARAEVRGRWREAAIRAANGASPRRLLARVLRRVVGTTLVGLGVGFVVGWSLVRAVVPAAGPEAGLAWGLAATFLVAVLAGAWGPAVRAGAADPAVLLREG